jgi:hypothetical protein
VQAVQKSSEKGVPIADGEWCAGSSSIRSSAIALTLTAFTQKTKMDKDREEIPEKLGKEEQT